MLIEENKALAPFTTFGIGGPARWYVEARTEQEIGDAAEWAQQRNVPLFVLGGGSNLLVADAGFGGLVLHVANRGIEIEPGGDEAVFRVAAGEDWNLVVQRAVAGNYAGIECLAGIPGTAGGTPVQNVGAYGQEVSTVIERVRVLDLCEGGIVDFGAGECGFGYRKSRFNTEDRGRYAVVRVDFRLRQSGAPCLRYADLQRTFAGADRPTLMEVAEEVRRIRRSKGMLLVEGDPDCRSAGSFFKNPVVREDAVPRIAARAGEEPPRFPGGEAGLMKIPAAWLIEKAGFRKGYGKGVAGISSRHTLALINRGGAKARDVMALAEEIRGTVEQRLGVLLEREPVLLGF
ncbi:UDP-N-acetylmuramate dehydrogenase [Acidobacteria bacterium AB60]|nr:UDP-N-acetylmuramate dehydrogenase [Acidobacteria bacterium AB60]